jgi:DNA-binding transcriptional MerR regulator
MPALILNSKAAKKCGVSTKTLERWDEKPELNFPPIVWVGGRKFRDADLVDAFILAQVRASATMARRPTSNEKKRASAKAANEVRQLKRRAAAQPAAEAV